jgi:hypothetical protein
MTPFGMTPPYTMETGLKEGATLSPVLYLVYVNTLLTEMHKTKLGVFTHNHTWAGIIAYADDLVFLAPDSDTLKNQLALLTKWNF